MPEQPGLQTKETTKRENRGLLCTEYPTAAPLYHRVQGWEMRLALSQEGYESYPLHEDVWDVHAIYFYMLTPLVCLSRSAKLTRRPSPAA